MSAVDRAMWAVLVTVLLLVGAVSAVRASTPAQVDIGTALVCDRSGCVES